MSIMYDRIEALCRQHGTNVTALCAALGLSRSSLTELKSGRTKRLSYEAISAIADHFGTTTDYVAGKTDDPAPPVHPDAELAEYIEELRTRPEMKMFFSLTKNATKDEVEAAAKIVEAYLKGRESGAGS